MNAFPGIGRLVALAFAWLFALNADASEPPADRLFGSHETLDVRIVAPIDILRQERPEKDYVSGKFFVNVDGDVQEFEVGIRTRGNFRRRPDVCAFPPLRLNFKKSEVKETLLDGQDKLKLVTHCGREAYTYKQVVVSEYLAYRMLNILSDVSFNVRLLEITYESPGGDTEFESYGILIEHKDSLAERIGAAPMTVEKIPSAELDRDYLNLTSVFHYLIGNTDYSPIAAAPGAECCHNHLLFGNETPPVYSVPYDFDMSGFVGAPYAAPNPKLKIDSVQERLYRGLCSNNERLPATLDIFLQKREEIETLIRSQEELASRSRRDKLKYVGQFYKTITSERRLQRSIIRRCI